MDIIISRMDQNQELFSRLIDDDQMTMIVKEMLLDKVYRRANG